MILPMMSGLFQWKFRDDGLVLCLHCSDPASGHVCQYSMGCASSVTEELPLGTVTLALDGDDPE